MLRQIPKLVVAGLLLTTVGLPVAASADHGDGLDEDEEAFAECVLLYRQVITDCPDYYDPATPDEDATPAAASLDLDRQQDDEQSFYECLKTGWIITYCLEKEGLWPFPLGA